MKTSLKISLHGKWNNEQQLCLWGVTASGESVPPLELKLLLLSGDPATYYGAHADTWEEGRFGGIKLSATAAFEYMNAPVCNPLLACEWSAPLQTLRYAAAELHEAMRCGVLIPSAGNDRIVWKLSGEADPNRYPILAGGFADDEQTGRWLSAWMREHINCVPEKREALRRMEQWLRTRQTDAPAAAPAIALRESDLLRLSGWTAPEQPYTAGFRLDDPQEAADDPAWTLTFVLVDRRGPTVAVDCDPYGQPVIEPPVHWSFAESEAKLLFASWLRAVPFLGGNAEERKMRTKLNDDEAWSFLTEISGQISDWGGTVLLPAWWNRLRASRPKLKAHLQPGQTTGEPSLFGLDQMLDFNWKLSVGNIELSEEEFLSIAEGQKPLHFVRGEWIALDRILVDHIRKAMERSKRKKGIPLREVLLRRFGKSEDSSLADDLSMEGRDSLDWEVETSGSLLRWIKQLDRSEEVPPVAVSPHFQGTLRGYQTEGLAWLAYLRRFGLGGCLADDMGLGKTIQYIAYLLHVKQQDAAGGPSLLICPTSLVGNWQKELERFAPGLRVYVHYGGGRVREPDAFREAVKGSDLVLTTYMTALLDIRSLQPVRWNSLCLDEAQNMKNAYTKQSSAIRRLAAVHRIAMTGTPVENRLSELWSIVDFLNPGYLGSLPTFERQYGRLAERNKRRAAEQLRRLIRPFMLRRMKSDPKIVPDLPDKVESKLFVPLTKEQAALYENVLDRLFGGLNERKGIDRRGSILAALTQLKQICDHPALFTKESGIAATAARHSHKTERLLEMVGELRAEGDRCLIFTQYVEMGFMLQRMLERALKEPVLYLHGGTSKLQRDRMVEQFQTADSDAERPPGIFVLSLKAGGTGLNLTAANHVFHYDRWWNPAVENQATDRAYRIGQQRLVQVHKFIALGTLEERIDEMIENKQSLSRHIIDSGDNWITELSTDELQDLFALRRSWLEG